MLIAAKIRELREGLGYTQAELALLVGVSREMINKYESTHNDAKRPRATVLFKLVRALKTSVDEIWQDEATETVAL